MGAEYLELLPPETSRLVLMLSSVNVINFYEGVIPVEYLKNRAKKIVAANPWLNTKLVKVDKTIKLRYASKDTWAFIDVQKNLGLHKDMKYDDIVRRVKPLLVRNGHSSLNTDEPLFKIIALIEDNTNTSALLLSVSHILADGHTFYSVYKMFDSKMAIIELNAERVREYWSNIESFRSDTARFLLSTKFILGSYARLLYPKSPKKYRMFL